MDQRAKWSANTKRYRRTPKGFLVRTYNNLRARARREGLTLALTADAFRAWAWDDPTFWRLYKRWIQFDYDRRQTPSLALLRGSHGYRLDNLAWLPYRVGAALGGLSPKRNSHEHLREVYEHATHA